MKKRNLILGTTLGLAVVTTGALAMVDSFSDVPADHWAATAIQEGRESGLWEGYEDGTFRPNDAVTRAEMAVLIDRNNTMMMDMLDHDMMVQKMNDMEAQLMEMQEKMDEMMGEATEEKMTIHLENLSADQTLSPGLLVVHTDAASLNWLDEMAPDELESLAEWGDATALKTLLEGMEGVKAVYMTEAMAPGATQDVMVNEMDETLHVSVIAMAVGSNDGYALVDSMMLKSGEMMMADNFDAGTEENSDLLSGFEGGQPDAEKTEEENINNGTATDPKVAVSAHPQLVDDLLKATVK